MWYIFSFKLSNLLPIALLRHSSLSESNHTTASSPLLIRYSGGISLSVGYTRSLASSISSSLGIFSNSAGGTWPLRAVSKSFAYAKFVGKSSTIHPFLSTSLSLDSSFSSSAISFNIASSALFFLRLCPS